MDYLNNSPVKIKDISIIDLKHIKNRTVSDTPHIFVVTILDYDSLSYPLNKGWEKYCEDNSISYLHALQIP